MSNQSFNNSLPTDQAFTGIENRNFLSPIGFKFNIGKMKGVDFFCQAAAIPAMKVDTAVQGTRFNKIPQPGDELDYDPLRIRFLIDENMKNYYQVHDWMRTIATPVSSKEFTYDRGSIDTKNRRYNQRDAETGWANQWKSDASLIILSSNYRPVAEFVFKDCFPTSLSTLNFDAAVQDIQYFTAEITLAYSHFDYFIYDAAAATDATMQPTYNVSGEGARLG